jgi:acetyl-CoA C-acetyltransferase
MRKIAIIGIGQTAVSEHWEKSLREIAGEAIFAAMLDAQSDFVEGIFIGNMLSGMLSSQENLGPLIADWAGLRNIESFKVEAACGSGAAALRMAIMAVGSGEINSAIALGVEKMSETRGTETTSALATAADSDYEIVQGLSFVAINALVMQRYMHEYHWRHTDFAPFAINAHANAVHNPNARLRETVDLNAYTRARMISDPINLLDASPIGDGAAALFIMPVDKLPRSQQNNRPIITIEGSAAATDTLAVHDRKKPLWLRAAELSSKKAYNQSGVSPSDIDVFELHDAFSIMAALSLEASGFAEPGTSPRLALNGSITPSGSTPISTLGGLKARGHPVGATGIYQVVEVTTQLRGEAGETQVQNARIGMAQNIGGSGATIITHIVKAS